MRPLLIDVTLGKEKRGVEGESEGGKTVDTNCHKRGVIRRTCLNFSKSALTKVAVYLQSVPTCPHPLYLRPTGCNSAWAAAATAQTKPQPVATHTLIMHIAPRIHLQLGPGFQLH